MSSIFFKKCDFLVFFLWFFNCFYCFVLQPKGSVLLGQGYFLITFIPVIFFSLISRQIHETIDGWVSNGASRGETTDKSH